MEPGWRATRCAPERRERAPPHSIFLAIGEAPTQHEKRVVVLSMDGVMLQSYEHDGNNDPIQLYLLRYLRSGFPWADLGGDPGATLHVPIRQKNEKTLKRAKR